ncbi:MAG: hypothetical protein JRH20_28655, partial [Deltaproteobacteria bacterium]|nr:hypothetical protein [Deltaproteobacteria bacterium]
MHGLCTDYAPPGVARGNRSCQSLLEEASEEEHVLKLAALLGYSMAITSCAGSHPSPSNAQEAKAGGSAKASATKASATKAEKKGPRPDRLAGAHILIAYKGAQRA